MSKETLKEAIEIYGKTIVSEVVNLVYMADADGSYTTFQDMGMDEHAECTEFLFFNWKTNGHRKPTNLFFSTSKP